MVDAEPEITELLMPVVGGCMIEYRYPEVLIAE